MPRKQLAQLFAEAVSVCCPRCGAAQPNMDGSEMWIKSDFDKKYGEFPCVSCDAPMQIETGKKAQFI